MASLTHYQAFVPAPQSHNRGERRDSAWDPHVGTGHPTARGCPKCRARWEDEFTGQEFLVFKCLESVLPHITGHRYA